VTIEQTNIMITIILIWVVFFIALWLGRNEIRDIISIIKEMNKEKK